MCRLRNLVPSRSKVSMQKIRKRLYVMALRAIHCMAGARNSNIRCFLRFTKPSTGKSATLTVRVPGWNPSLLQQPGPKKFKPFQDRANIYIIYRPRSLSKIRYLKRQNSGLRGSVAQALFQGIEPIQRLGV